MLDNHGAVAPDGFPDSIGQGTVDSLAIEPELSTIADHYRAGVVRSAVLMT